MNDETPAKSSRRPVDMTANQIRGVYARIQREYPRDRLLAEELLDIENLLGQIERLNQEKKDGDLEKIATELRERVALMAREYFTYELRHWLEDYWMLKFPIMDILTPKFLALYKKEDQHSASDLLASATHASTQLSSTLSKLLVGNIKSAYSGPTSEQLERREFDEIARKVLLNHCDKYTRAIERWFTGAAMLSHIAPKEFSENQSNHRADGDVLLYKICKTFVEEGLPPSVYQSL